MSVGTLVKWHKKAGDLVKNGDILAEVETDKATMELENFDDGTLLEIFVGEGDEVPIGSPLAAVGEPGEEVTAPTKPADEPVEEKAEKKEIPPQVSTTGRGNYCKRSCSGSTITTRTTANRSHTDYW